MMQNKPNDMTDDFYKAYGLLVFVNTYLKLVSFVAHFTYMITCDALRFPIYSYIGLLVIFRYLSKFNREKTNDQRTDIGRRETKNIRLPHMFYTGEKRKVQMPLYMYTDLQSISFNTIKLSTCLWNNNKAPTQLTPAFSFVFLDATTIILIYIYMIIMVMNIFFQTWIEQREGWSIGMYHKCWMQGKIL